MKKNLSKVFGVLIAVLSLTGLAACLVHFNKTENVSSPSSSNNTTSTEEENPPIPFVEEDESYLFEDGKSYRISLDSLCTFYQNLMLKTEELNDGFVYQSLMNFDFTDMNYQVEGSDEYVGIRILGFPNWIDGNIKSKSSSSFRETYLSWVPFNEDGSISFSALLDCFVNKLCDSKIVNVTPPIDPPNLQIENRRVTQYRPYYSYCSFALRDNLYVNTAAGKLFYEMLLDIEFNIPSTTFDEFSENIEALTYLSYAFGSFTYPEDPNPDGSMTYNFTVKLGGACDYHLNGYLQGFVFNKAKQVLISDKWNDDVFNAWMYANLYAEEMSV